MMQLKNMSKVRSLCVFAMLLFFLAVTGCQEENMGKEAALPGDDPNVLAMVGDVAITRADLDLALESVPESRREGLKKRVLDDLVGMKVFYAEGVRAGLLEDSQVQEELTDTEDDALARLFVKENVDKEAEPSEAVLKQYYEDHKKDYQAPEAVLLQQIQVKDRKDAEVVLKELKAGTSFAELAKKASTARSWKEGGSMGWQYRGWLEPSVEKVAFGLEVGQLSDIIKTEKGYDVIRVVDKKESREVPFEEAKASIRTKLFSTKKKELVDGYYEKAGVNRDPGQEGVLARIGEEAITEASLAPKLEPFSDKEKAKAKTRWLDYLIEKKVFSGEARRTGFDKSPDVVRMVEMTREQILAKTFYERFIKSKFSVTDQEIQAYYDTHQYEFNVPARYRVKAILVKTREEAEAIEKELEKGASFAGLAIAHSLHPMAKDRAGEIGWFSAGEKDPALEQVAQALDKGQNSGIIETRDGYEFIKLMDKKGGGVAPLDSEVKKRIENNLLRQRLEEEKQRYYDKAGVKVLAS